MTQPATTHQLEHLCPNLRHLEPVDGQPIWCRPDQERIVRAISRLPDLAAALYEQTGITVPEVEQVVLRGPLRVSTAVPKPERWRDVLACEHHIDYDRTPRQRFPDSRRCGRCALASPVGAGKLAASGQSDTTRKATRAGSPSGSPAWDVIDEVVTWAGDLEDRLRGTLNHSRPDRTYWTGTTVVRATHLTASVAYLTTWSTALLSSPLAVQAGREALQLERRVERAAGLDRLRHRLPAPCPSCDRKALIRDDGAEQVDCVACGRRWTEADYRRLVVVLSDELQDVPAKPRPTLTPQRDGSGRSWDAFPTWPA